MNRPVDHLCKWIRSEMRYESWEELLDALEREMTINGVPVRRQIATTKLPPSPVIERMMSLACPKRKRYAA